MANDSQVPQKMADGNVDVYALLLAGGSGTRMWPVSRQLYPKQLVSFLGADSLVQSTVKRLAPVIAGDHVRVVCGREHVEETVRHLQQVGFSPDGCIISEPCGRNTAPAILLAVMHIRDQVAADPVVCVFPADHVIRDNRKFHDKIATAVELAREGHIVTFGIQPTYPETGYGYIEAGDPVGRGGQQVRRFVEKPRLEVARQYLRSGNFFWNSGMFAFKVSVILEAFIHLQPVLYEQMGRIVSSAQTASLEAYCRLPNVSVDYAIMEKTDNCVVVPSNFGWSDIGSWKSLYDYCEKDGHGNVISGDVIFNETENCFIMAHDRLIAANYLRNLVIVETPNSVFVSGMENSREVKSIVEHSKAKGRKEFQQHRTVHHHWGSICELDRRQALGVERLELYGGAKLVIRAGKEQTHLYVIGGEINVKLQGKEAVVPDGGSWDLPSGATGQVANLKNSPVTLIVVKSA